MKAREIIKMVYELFLGHAPSGKEITDGLTTAIAQALAEERSRIWQVALAVVSERNVKHMHDRFCSCDPCGYRNNYDDESVGWNYAREKLIEACKLDKGI